ncbi:MAG: alpha/beta hydrolase [Clostridia bacterium]|nr:alpha/beta hydrolase [Clostridia bacterium]
MACFDYENHRIYYECHGAGEPLILLHGNTASGRMFDPLIPILSAGRLVVTMDFLGCGRSDHLSCWPCDLWAEWSKQVYALCRHNGFARVSIAGASGGALAAINAAMAYPQLVHAVIADSFAGIEADPQITAGIRAGRAAAKRLDGFCAYQQSVHGDDWEAVLDADTDAVLRHAESIGAYFQRPLSSLKVRLLLTGSDEDEMLPAGHCRRLFGEIARQTPLAQAHVFAHGGHPAMLSNMEAFAALLDRFLDPD